MLWRHPVCKDFVVEKPLENTEIWKLYVYKQAGILMEMTHYSPF